MSYDVTRDGKVLANFELHNDAFAYLHGIQSQSVDWACKYEGYAITEHQEPRPRCAVCGGFNPGDMSHVRCQ